MDPWDAHSDARMWEVLRAVQLGAAVRKLGGLDARMAEAGNNLSVGQRQLFCLARCSHLAGLPSCALPMFNSLTFWLDLLRALLRAFKLY